MDQRAAATLAAAGYDPSRHRARTFDAGWHDDHDLVLAMDAANLRDVGGSGDRTRLFRAFDPEAAANRTRRCPTRTTVGLPVSRRCCAWSSAPARRSWPRCAGSWPGRDPAAADRQARRGAARGVGGLDRARGRRRHLDRHPDAAQRRHHRPDEDPPPGSRRVLRRRGARAALARRGRRRRRRRGARGARPRPRVPDPAVGGARQDDRRRRRRARPVAGARPTGPGPTASARSTTASSAGCRCPTGPPTAGRSSTPPGGCCPTSSWRATGAPPPPTTRPPSSRWSAG